MWKLKQVGDVMLNQETNLLLQNRIKELVIPASKVAHVQLGNSLEHALLVLIKSRYSAVPVLDAEYKIKGQISKTMILESILGLERIEYEKLESRNVEEVMDSKIPRMKEEDQFLKALELSINHPYVCIEDADGVFLGILTRRSLLAVIYQYFRQK